jgi:hypothetical protein
VVDEAKTGYQKEWRNDVVDWIAATGDSLPDWAREMSQYSDRYEGTAERGKKDYRRAENR